MGRVWLSLRPLHVWTVRFPYQRGLSLGRVQFGGGSVSFFLLRALSFASFCGCVGSVSGVGLRFSSFLGSAPSSALVAILVPRFHGVAVLWSVSCEPPFFYESLLLCSRSIVIVGSASFGFNVYLNDGVALWDESVSACVCSLLLSLPVFFGRGDPYSAVAGLFVLVCVSSVFISLRYAFLSSSGWYLRVLALFVMLQFHLRLRVLFVELTLPRFFSLLVGLPGCGTLSLGVPSGWFQGFACFVSVSFCHIILPFRCRILSFHFFPSLSPLFFHGSFSLTPFFLLLRLFFLHGCYDSGVPCVFFFPRLPLPFSMSSPLSVLSLWLLALL